MTLRNQSLFWLLSFAAFLGFIYVFKSVLLPFVLGIAVAYLLNPLVRGFEKIKIGRAPAALTILLTFFSIVLLVLVLAVPVLYRQTLDLAADTPGYIDQLWLALEPHYLQIRDALGIHESANIKTLLQDHAGTGLDVAKKVLKSLAAGGQAIFDIIYILVFMPIVAYFILKEWNKIAAWVEDLLPRDHKKTIQDLLAQIDAKISGFIRGQISIAVILGIIYSVALTIAGLKYGFLIGLSAGLLSIIPMVGSTLGLLTSIAVAWFQSGDLMFVALIGAIFLIGQFIEGNILSPKIVGDSVGLHPLWVFFALIAGGALFGILGMLLAVPVAAVAGVLLAFAITQYKASPMYKGKAKPKAKPAKKAKA